MFQSFAILELKVILLGLLCPAACFSSRLSPAAEPPAPALLSYSLLSASRNGDLAAVKKLLASGENINASDMAGDTPLMAATIAGHSEVVVYLISANADVNFRRSQNDATALYYAVAVGRADLVRDLVSAGAKLDLRYAQGQTIAHLAAMASCVDCLRFILAAHADMEALNLIGNTPLDEAVLHGRTENVSSLLLYGADVRRVRSSDGRGALQEACVKGYPALVRLLVKAGADPTSRDRWDQTPVDLALAYKNRNVVVMLLRLARGDAKLQATVAQAMERATNKGQVEILRILIDSGFDVNQPTSDGSTYLDDAALKGQAGAVRLLLDRGARIIVRNQTGGTPLHDAAISGNPDVLTLLLDRGCPIDARDLDSGATPLMVAASLGRTEIVSLLLKRGANPTLKDNLGRTALNRAQEGQDLNLVKLLKDARA